MVVIIFDNFSYIYIYTLQRFSNWPPYKIWYYATYLIKKYKVWLFLYCTHQSIDLQKENTYSCTKSSMLNGRCENSQCARIPRARHGSCRIWQEFILRWWSFIKKTLNMARMSIAERAQAVGMIRAGTPIRQVCYASL